MPILLLIPKSAKGPQRKRERKGGSEEGIERGRKEEREGGREREI